MLLGFKIKRAAGRPQDLEDVRGLEYSRKFAHCESNFPTHSLLLCRAFHFKRSPCAHAAAHVHGVETFLLQQIRAVQAAIAAGAINHDLAVAILLQFCPTLAQFVQGNIQRAFDMA